MNHAEMGVYHELSGYWYLWLSGSNTMSYQKLGESGYSPVTGEYDGDGKADLAGLFSKVQSYYS